MLWGPNLLPERAGIIIPGLWGPGHRCEALLRAQESEISPENVCVEVGCQPASLKSLTPASPF